MKDNFTFDTVHDLVQRLAEAESTLSEPGQGSTFIVTLPLRQKDRGGSPS